jgi:von Willebrand factor type A domain
LKTHLHHLCNLFAVFGIAIGFAMPAVAEEDGVAVAIVYDTSGSMGQAVKGSDGVSTAKHIIAKRALVNVLNRLQAYASSGTPGSPRVLKVGLYSFQKDGAREVAPLAIFDPQTATLWPNLLPLPAGGTPLGLTVESGAHAVLKSGLRRKHVLVITDGENTVGPDPAGILGTLNDLAGKQGTAVSIHFIAFDVDAKVFAPLKKRGATVLTAADEAQLNTQLGFILEKKILLEDEEPAPAPKNK